MSITVYYIMCGERRFSARPRLTRIQCILDVRAHLKLHPWEADRDWWFLALDGKKIPFDKPLDGN